MVLLVLEQGAANLAASGASELNGITVRKTSSALLVNTLGKIMVTMITHRVPQLCQRVKAQKLAKNLEIRQL